MNTSAVPKDIRSSSTLYPLPVVAVVRPFGLPDTVVLFNLRIFILSVVFALADLLELYTVTVTSILPEPPPHKPPKATDCVLTDGLPVVKSPSFNISPSPVPDVTLTTKSSPSSAFLINRPEPTSTVAAPPLTDTPDTVILK